jgi:ADP-ribose pyrophosphatase YjhB (NUDIX family)
MSVFDPAMNFCNACGGPLGETVPEGDNRPRHVCRDCGAIHYRNPKVVTGCIPAWEDQVLLCRRAIRPRYGLWTVPAGFLENGESSHQGAIRETFEEANARVDIEALYSTFNLPHIDQIYMLFRARLLDLDFGPGEESLEVRLFREHEVPWDELAFPVVAETLKLYFCDQASGRFAIHMGDIVREPGASLGDYRVTML